MGVGRVRARTLGLSQIAQPPVVRGIGIGGFTDMLRLIFFLTAATVMVAYAQVDALREFFEYEASQSNTDAAEEFELERVRLRARIELQDAQAETHMREFRTHIVSGTCDPALMDLTLDLAAAYALLAAAISDQAGLAEDMLVEEMAWKNRALEAYFSSARTRR